MAHAGLQRAELLAFTALVEAKLEPATTYTTWCEGESYRRHTRAAYGAGLPLPLSYWLPWSQRRAALRRFAASSREQVCRQPGVLCPSGPGRSRMGSGSRQWVVECVLACTQIYADAAAVYAALADHLRGTAGKGAYFFGAQPSSLDAALFAHLALHHSAPVSAPELRQVLGLLCMVAEVNKAILYRLGMHG